jgi:iron complex outermembrane receptor protein
MARTRVFSGSVLVACLISAPLLAAPQPDIAIPAGPLGPAIAELARQSGIDIGSTDRALALARTRGVRGRMSPRAAIDRLLAGSGYRAVAIGGDAFRIERIDRGQAAPRRAASPLPAAAPALQDGGEEILVTASKHDVPVLRFPGSVVIVRSIGLDAPGTGNARDLHAIASHGTIVQTTALGDGRNKLFVRGIADSSFAGPTRSTANVYLGEVQLGYNGADPNLHLYDIDRVEILEGPQGALYGAGSIGGVIRLTPRAPDPTRIAASATATTGFTQGGDPSYGLSGMVNLPIGSAVALRLVGYQSHDGGYIDDLRRHRDDINHSRTRGGRAALRIAPGDGWTIDFGGVLQQIDAPDSQYTLAGLGLARRSALAQPFAGHFRMAQATVTRRWDSGLQLVSATGVVRNRSDDRYDASVLRPSTGLAYDTHDRNKMFSQETRLSRSIGPAHSWLIGLTYIDDEDAIQRKLGLPNQPQDITGVTNVSKDLSAFGELTLPLTSALSLTGGGRLTHTRTASDPAFARRDAQFVRGASSSRFSPLAAIDWLVTPRIALYARYGSGFRTGGLAVAPGVGRVANFIPDRIRVIEGGVRLQRSGPRGLSATAALSQAVWTNVQADLIDRRGFPYSTNVGRARIDGIEASADWAILPGLSITGALFANHSRLTDPIEALAAQKNEPLPDTPRLAVTGGATRRWAGAAGAEWSLSAVGRYTSRSRVGVGERLNMAQGGYARFDIAGGWQRDGLAIGLALDNLANVRGDRFALGNSFGLADRNQRTPERPRTARISVTLSR